jgi:hypothetical protein
MREPGSGACFDGDPQGTGTLSTCDVHWTYPPGTWHCVCAVTLCSIESTQRAILRQLFFSTKTSTLINQTLDNNWCKCQ